MWGNAQVTQTLGWISFFNLRYRLVVNKEWDCSAGIFKKSQNFSGLVPIRNPGDHQQRWRRVYLVVSAPFPHSLEFHWLKTFRQVQNSRGRGSCGEMLPPASPLPGRLRHAGDQTEMTQEDRGLTSHGCSVFSGTGTLPANLDLHVHQQPDEYGRPTTSPASEQAGNRNRVSIRSAPKLHRSPSRKISLSRRQQSSPCLVFFFFTIGHKPWSEGLTNWFHGSP